MNTETIYWQITKAKEETKAKASHGRTAGNNKEPGLAQKVEAKRTEPHLPHDSARTGWQERALEEMPAISRIRDYLELPSQPNLRQ